METRVLLCIGTVKAVAVIAGVSWPMQKADGH